jgi:acetyl esterase/lipase
LDPDRLFVLGSSAGGFLSSYLGATEDELSIPDGVCEDGASGTVALRGIITFFGPSDWNALYADPLRAGGGAQESAFLGITALPPCAPGSADAADICLRASATAHLAGGEPDFFVAHSIDDPTIPVGQSRLLVEQLRARGSDVTLREVDGLGHGWHARFVDPTVAAIRDEIVAWSGVR